MRQGLWLHCSHLSNTLSAAAFETVAGSCVHRHSVSMGRGSAAMASPVVEWAPGNAKCSGAGPLASMTLLSGDYDSYN
jgi:hypothetical protein